MSHSFKHLQLLLAEATEAPWHIEENPKWDRGGHGGDAKFARIKCGPWTVFALHTETQFSRAETQANAALIVAMHAALPKLIAVAEASQCLLKWYVYARECQGLTREEIDSLAHVQAVRAALSSLKEAGK